MKILWGVDDGSINSFQWLVTILVDQEVSEQLAIQNDSVEIETGLQWYLTNNHGGKGHVIDLMGIDQAMGMGYTIINEDSSGFQGI